MKRFLLENYNGIEDVWILTNPNGNREVKIDARDITVKMMLKIGRKIIDKTTDFYETTITPMVIQKKDFIL